MAKVLRYTPKLGRAVAAKAIISGKPKRYHIISTFNRPGWSMVYEGALRSSKNFSTKQAAISYAKKSPNKSISEIIVHDKDGGIQNIIPLKSK